MSDCGPGRHSAQEWRPAARCRDCGHRITTAATRPVATRRLPLRYWLYELAARYVATHPVTETELRS